jgi:hypothetical protein
MTGVWRQDIFAAQTRAVSDGICATPGRGETVGDISVLLESDY